MASAAARSPAMEPAWQCASIRRHKTQSQMLVLAPRRGLKAGRRMELFALLTPLRVGAISTGVSHVQGQRRRRPRIVLLADPRAPPGKRSAHRRLRLGLLGDVEDPAALRGGCRGTLGVLKLEKQQWLDRHVEKAANVGVG